MKPTLVILAAGMASRYGSLKQIAGFGPGKETIIEYSIYDAIEAGFGKVVFIIRRSFADDFKEIFEPKLHGKIEVDYVFQELDSYIEGYQYPADRTKPWGTAHAVLCARDAVNEPFAVINADDFYGRNAFFNATDFLINYCNEKNYGLVAYNLRQTLSEYGTVNRGVCTVDKWGKLASINERINIALNDEKITCNDGKEPVELLPDSPVSMNFWCFDVSFFNYTLKLFNRFLEEHGQELKSEFFIPAVVDQFINEGGRVTMIPTTANWFGVTYMEDAPFVEDNISQLVNSGVYPASLW